MQVSESSPIDVMTGEQRVGDNRLSVPECMTMFFAEEAEKCRSQASAFAGKPEAPFLLRIARAFDELALDHPARDVPRREDRFVSR